MSEIRLMRAGSWAHTGANEQLAGMRTGTGCLVTPDGLVAWWLNPTPPHSNLVLTCSAHGRVHEEFWQRSDGQAWTRKAISQRANAFAARVLSGAERSTLMAG